MVTYFNRKDLVSFGNYLLSEKRKTRIIDAHKSAKEEGMNLPDEPDPQQFETVNHADFWNWLDDNKKRASADLD